MSVLPYAFFVFIGGIALLFCTLLIVTSSLFIGRTAVLPYAFLIIT